MKWYPKQWLSDPKARCLTLAEEGAFRRILDLMWVRSSGICAIENDDKVIGRNIGVRGIVLRQIKNKLISLGMLVLHEDNLLRSPRLSLEYECAQQVTASQRRKSLKRLDVEIGPLLRSRAIYSSSPEMCKSLILKNEEIAADEPVLIPKDIRDKEKIRNTPPPPSFLSEVFALWNTLPGLQKHVSLGAHKQKIETAIKRFGVHAVKQAIERYSLWRCNGGGRYRSAYPWTISQFVSRDGGAHVERLAGDDWEVGCLKFDSGSRGGMGNGPDRTSMVGSVPGGSATVSIEAHFCAGCDLRQMSERCVRCGAGIPIAIVEGYEDL